jgi:hypothetical protein
LLLLGPTHHAPLLVVGPTQEEADYLDGSDFEGISESESEAPSDDDDWQPGQRRRASGSAALNSKKARQ